MEKIPEEDTHIFPKGRKLMAGTLAGSIVLVLGIVVGARGLRQQSCEITFPAALLFIGEYVLAHYSDTGDLL